MIIGQAIIVFFGGDALSTKPLDGTQWGISLGLGAMSLVVAVIIRLIPDELIRNLIRKAFRRSDDASYISIRSNRRFQWNDTIENVRDELAFFKSIRGRRFNGFFSSQEIPRAFSPSSGEDMTSQSPEAQRLMAPSPSPSLTGMRSRSTSALGPATVMAGVIAGSIAGWAPRELGNADNGLSNVP
jgi:P-type Ca2+ transporter type 2C